MAKQFTHSNLIKTICIGSALALSGCVATSMGTHGIVPGYAAYCNERHDDRPLSAGVLWGEGGAWSSNLSDTVPVSERQGLSEKQIGYFTREQALEECRKHLEDFPGHPCRIRKVGFDVGGMG